MAILRANPLTGADLDRKLANDTTFGLGATVWTNDPAERPSQRLRRGPGGPPHERK